MTLLVIALGVGAAAPASAGPKPIKPLNPTTKAKPVATKIPTKPVAKGGATTSAGATVELHKSGKGTVTMTNATLGERSTALSGFDFRFGNGDHKIKAISLLADDEHVTAQFNDNDGNDTFEVWAQYTTLAAARHFDTGSVHGLLNTDVAIEGPRAGEVFVLTGFSVTRRHSDNRVKRFAIRPSPERGVVRVEFMTDGVPDPSNHWDVRLQYAYVPQSAIAGQHSAASPSVGFKSGPKEIARRPGTPLLQGFDLYFAKGGQFLRDFAIRPSANHFKVEFNDGGADEYVMASVDYALLR